MNSQLTSSGARALPVPAAWTGAEAHRPYKVERLDQIVAQQAVRTPTAVALHEGSRSITYGDMMRQARRLAHILRARDIGREDLVAVCIDRSIEQMVSVLGVLLAGAAYVPIDPQGPAERRRFMLEDSRPRAILTRGSFESIPSELHGIALTVDTLLEGQAEDVPLPPIGTVTDVAYVIYTSGSTGTPKGVLNQHDGANNHVAWMADAYPLSTADRVLGKTPAVFDVSVWEWFWPLSMGASLVLLRPGGEKDPAYALDVIQSYGVTNIHFVPTLLRLFLERTDLHRAASLQRVFCSGEELTGELRDEFFARMPGPPLLVNLYGPTEAAVNVTGWTCSPTETGPVPIGHPLPNTRIYIVDEAMNPVPQGVKGELLIGGIQVARGYLRRPELTAQRFIPDPFGDNPTAHCYRTGDCVSWRADGAIDFFGRYDSQVQLGGVRVELGEIETELRKHPAVADVAVLARITEDSKRLVAYLRRADTTGRRPDPSVDSMRRFLAATLADFMTPAWFIWLDDFPTTPTGKLDRRALPKPEVARPSIEQAFEPPQSGTETRLARIWCAVLQLDRVGRHDDFHLLGGDSLSALRLFEGITREFGIELPLIELMQAPTVAQLAARLDAGERRDNTTSIVTLRPGTNGAALFLPPSMGGELLYWRELVQALAPGRPVYGFALPADCEDPADLHALAAALVRDLIAFQPDGPYHLAGYSFSAAVAFEMAQQLRASGRTVGVLAMIDYGPGLPESWGRRLRTTGQFFANLPYWLRYDILQAGWPDVAARARRKLATVGHRIRHLGRPDPAREAERAVDEMFDQLALPGAHRRLVIDQLKAYYRYQPVEWPGRILLFWARCRPLTHSLAPDLGWNRYARGGFTRVVVKCNHDNILNLPHVRGVAAALDDALNQSALTSAPGQRAR